MKKKPRRVPKTSPAGFHEGADGKRYPTASSESLIEFFRALPNVPYPMAADDPVEQHPQPKKEGGGRQR
jgi:hypothetical protein